MTKLDRIVLYAIAVVSIAGLFLPAASSILGGDTNFDSLDVANGYKVDGTTLIDGSGNISITGSSTVGKLQIDSGTAVIDEHSCNTLSWDPPAFSSTTIASTTISLTGAAVGDLALASFSSASSTDQWIAEARVTAAGTSTAFLRAFESPAGDHVYNLALNMVTSTLRVCYFAY